MAERILFVDDEPGVLAEYRRQFGSQYDVATACGSKEGIAAIRNGEPFAAIVSDMCISGMDGARFLVRAEELAPDSVRVLVTDSADQSLAVSAVNEGNIFQFLTKPCPAEWLARALAAAVRQHRLLRSEKELLEQTLRGSVRVLTEVLSLVNPLAFGRATRVQRLARAVAHVLGGIAAWQLEVAALLSQLGCVTIPEGVLNKVYLGESLNDEESAVFDRHPTIAAGLLRSIPRMEAVAEIIACQERRFDGSGAFADGRKGTDIPFGARILKAVLDFDSMESRDHSPPAALDCMRGRTGWYDPEVLEALGRLPWEDTGYRLRSVRGAELRPGMVLAEDLASASGVLLMRKGQHITDASLSRLQNLVWKNAVPEPFKVLTPSKSSSY
jgi:response regulator RpfG family c-di-GMP phosphodiesterase